MRYKMGEFKESRNFPEEDEFDQDLDMLDLDD